MTIYTLPTDELTIKYILNTLGRAVTNQSPEQLQTLKDNEYNQLWLHAPSTAVIGENIKFTVQAWDSYERLATLQNYYLMVTEKLIINNLIKNMIKKTIKIFNKSSYMCYLCLIILILD